MNIPLRSSHVVASALLCIATMATCANRANDCEASGTCEGIAGAGGDGGRKGDGAGGTGTRTSEAPGQAQGGSGGVKGASGGFGTTDSSSFGASLGIGAGGDATYRTTRTPCDGRCADPEPVCDIGMDRCVTCLVNGDCRTAGSPVCSPERRCVECTASAECATDPSRPVCAAQRCVQCTRSSECVGDASRPVCNPNTNLCVGCMESGDCKDNEARICNPSTNLCVGCLANTDCTASTASACNPTKNVCVPCSTDKDCSHVPGKGVCDAGTCVECTGKKNQACGMLGGVALVCNSLTKTCSTDQRALSSGLCQPCISDLQCRKGQLCLSQSYKGKFLGHFCFWKQGDTANGAPADCALESNRPYVNLQSNATSIDGESANLCTLRGVSTCKAIHQYSAVDCAPNGAAEPQLCGVAPGEDALCVPFGTTQYRCTNACLSADDCVGSGTGSSITCDSGTTPRVCTLN